MFQKSELSKEVQAHPTFTTLLDAVNFTDHARQIEITDFAVMRS